MQIISFCGPISVGRWSKEGGGYNAEYEKTVQDDVNEFLANCLKAEYTIKDIKVDHFTIMRHNNGGCDEVWVQYTILYEGSI